MKNAITSLRSNRQWLAVITLSLLTSHLKGTDWPQFMGPDSNGISQETGLLRAWPEQGPKILWTVPLGAGYGSAAIRDGKVYVLDRVEQKQDVLRCLDLTTGKEEWTFAYDAPGAIDHDGSRSTPAVSENYIFTIGPFGHIYCIDRTSHQVVWKKNLVTDFGTQVPRWVVSISPLLYHDQVIIAPQSPKAGIVALDQATGKEHWRSHSIGSIGYGSPMLAKLGGVEQFIIVNPQGASSVSAKEGKLLWQYGHPCKIPIPNVTLIGSDKLFVTGAYKAGSALIQVSQQGEQWNVKELSRNNQIGGHCHPALFYQDHLYILCNVNERSDGMVCFDANGQLMWQTKNMPNLDKGGSILTGDGLIYVMDGKSGELHIMEPSPTAFKSLGKAKLLEGREIWAPLSLADGKLVIRDQSQMKCLDIKAP